MKHSRILVTGGGGFIGHNLFRYLTTLDEEPEVRLFDKLYGQDLTRWEDVKRAWEWEPDAVINLASDTHIDTSITDPGKFWKNNLELVFNVLEACRLHDCRMIQISSSEVYGTSAYLPMDELHPIQPHSPYAATKVAQDRACYAWWQTYGLDVSIVRPFNQFGTYQQLEKMIPKTVKRIVDGLPIPVYATGTARRDWVYVKETVRGLWMALQGLPAGDVVNLATGKSYSVVELVNEIKSVMVSLGYEDNSKIATVEHTEDREGHVYHLEGSTAKARRLLGWVHETTMEEALKETAQWYLTQHWGVVSR